MRLLKGEANSVELSKEIGCHPTIIGEWRDRLITNAPKIFQIQTGENEKDKKIAKLERLIGKLTAQNDFLDRVLEHYN